MDSPVPPPCQSGDGWRRWVTHDPDDVPDFAPPPCQSGDNWKRWVAASPVGSTSTSSSRTSSQAENEEASSTKSVSQISDLGWEGSPTSGLSASSKAVAEKCLKKRVAAGDRRAVFYLGQLYFDTAAYEKAQELFLTIASSNVFAQYQLGVMMFEGLGFEQDLKKGFRMMLTVALSKWKTPEQEEVIHKAQYNIARAYFTGHGTSCSEDDAKRWLDRAADDGSKLGSVKAQTMLGMWFSRGDRMDLKKAFFWHSEATGNGSLESQGALGVLYLYGLGVRRDLISARQCLREAAQRGNIYAAGQLCLFYYMYHFYEHAIRLGALLCQYGEADVAQLSRQSECLPRYIRRGIAIGCFVLARCLLLGQGLQTDAAKAQKLGGMATKMDIIAADDLQNMTMNGPWLTAPDQWSAAE